MESVYFAKDVLGLETGLTLVPTLGIWIITDDNGDARGIVERPCLMSTDLKWIADVPESVQKVIEQSRFHLVGISAG